MDITRILKNIAFIHSKVNILKGHRQVDPHIIMPKCKPVSSHVIGWKYPVHWHNPPMIRWTIVVWCTENHVLRSLIRPLFQPEMTCTEKSHEIQVKALDLDHPHGIPVMALSLTPIDQGVIVFVWELTSTWPYHRTHLHYNLVSLDSWTAEILEKMILALQRCHPCGQLHHNRYRFSLTRCWILGKFCFGL